MPDTSIYSPSSFRKFLEILRRGGKFAANPRTLFLLTEDDRRKVYGALGEGREGARQDEKSVIADSNLPVGTLLAYLSGWDDCSEVVLRLPKAENVPSYPETRPEAPARRETDQKQGSGEVGEVSWYTKHDPEWAFLDKDDPKSPKN